MLCAIIGILAQGGNLEAAVFIEFADVQAYFVCLLLKDKEVARSRDGLVEKCSSVSLVRMAPPIVSKKSINIYKCIVYGDYVRK